MATSKKNAEQQAAEEMAVPSNAPEPAEPMQTAGALTSADAGEGGVKVKVIRPQGWFFGGALHAHGTVLEVPKISVDEAFVEKV